LLLGLILKRVTHQTLSEYLQERIGKPPGMEYPATWSIDSDQDELELAYVLLNARAIDFAKFGQLFLNNGNWNGKQIISERWVIESTYRYRKPRPVTECDSCASGRRDVRVPALSPVHRTIATEVTERAPRLKTRFCVSR
jgi:CubicO group peptidase (beta-lactamase class C family)